MAGRRAAAAEEADFRGFSVEEALDNAAVSISRVEDSAGALVRKWVKDGGAQVEGALGARALARIGGVAGGGGGPLGAALADPARGAREAAAWVESRVEALARSIADTRAVAGGAGGVGGAGGGGAGGAPLGRGRALGAAALAVRARGSAAAAQLLRAAAAPLVVPRPAGVVAEPPRARRAPRSRESGAYTHGDAEDAALAAWQQEQQQHAGGGGGPSVAVDLPEVAVRDGQLFLEGERVDDVRQKARRRGMRTHAPLRTRSHSARAQRSA
jgi:hypothetical protein